MNCVICGEEILDPALPCKRCGAKVSVGAGSEPVEDLWDDPIWSDDTTALGVRQDENDLPGGPGDDSSETQILYTDDLPASPWDDDAASVDAFDHTDEHAMARLAEDLDDDGGRVPMPWVPPVGTGLAGLGWALLHLPDIDSVTDGGLLAALGGTMLIGVVLGWGFNRGARLGGHVAAGLLGALPMIAEVLRRLLHDGGDPEASGAIIAVAVPALSALVLAVVLARAKAVAPAAMLIAGSIVTAFLAASAADGAPVEEHRWVQAAMAAVVVATLASGLLQQDLVDRAANRADRHGS